MSADIVVIIIFSVLGLAAHGARNHPWMEWTLRVIYSFAFVAELWTAFVVLPAKDGMDVSAWSVGVTAVMATLTGLVLFKPCREAMSYVLSGMNDVISGQLLYGAWCVKQHPQLAPLVVEHKVDAVPADQPAAPQPEEESEAFAAGSPDSSATPVGKTDSAHGVQTIFRAPSLVATAAPLIGARSWKDYWLVDRVFVADSLPHLNAAWIYITVLGSLLANLNLENFSAPAIGIPFPVPLDSLFSYNFLGLIVLAVSGCGIIVARRPGEVMKRLGLVKPEGWHVGLALLMVFVTFGYDWLWSVFTGATGVGGKLATYNAGTFAAAGGNPGPAAFLALATGVCAGAGEEILMRGGLQPVLGIVPAAILHGALHGQFQHAPILIVQVAGWSTLMGIVRRYTNTTTTLITHATFNFLTTFLFAFNP